MKTRTFRPRFEMLEGRFTPAGNVTALTLGGSLLLVGDGQDNALAVSQPAPGQFTVTPEAGTTVNGRADPATFAGVTRDVIAWLGGGDDRLRLGDFSGSPIVIGRNLAVFGGAGNNSVESFDPLEVGRDLLLMNLGGDDRTDLFGQLTVGGGVTIANGDGDNSTNIATFSGPSTVGGDLRIINGFGSDTSAVSGTSVGGDVRFDSGGADPDAGFTTHSFDAGFSGEPVTVGGDVQFTTTSGAVSNVLLDVSVGGDVRFVAEGAGTAGHEIGTFNGGDFTVGGDVTVRSTGGDARVSVGGVGFQFRPGLAVGGDLRIVTGDGADEVTLTHLAVGESTAIATGSGADVVAIDDSDFGGRFTLRTEGGADAVRVERRLSAQLEGPTMFGDRVSVDLGRDDDTLQLGRAGDPTRVVRLSGAARFDGGPGTDLRDDANVTAGSAEPVFVSFEKTAPPPLLLGPVRYPVAGEYVVAVRTGDFNADGVADLVTVERDSRSVSVLLGNGDGTFGPAVGYAAGRTPSSVAVADFNGDGKQDLAVSNDFGNGTVSVLLGNGDGTFRSRVASPAAPGFAPVQLAAGDFNADGKQDVVTVNRSGAGRASISVLLGTGTGTFGPPTVIELVSPDPDLFVRDGSTVTVGDVNGDGKQDVVAGTLGALAVLLGNGDGSFAAPLVDAPRSPIFGAIVLADLNRDGKLDLALGGNSLDVQLGNGDGTFGEPTTLLEEGTNGVAVGDFNADGIPDVAAGHFPEMLGVFLGNGDGTFRPPHQFEVADDGPVAVADFNGDGLPDVAVGNQETQSVSVFLNSGRVTG